MYFVSVLLHFYFLLNCQCNSTLRTRNIQYIYTGKLSDNTVARWANNKTECSDLIGDFCLQLSLIFLHGKYISGFMQVFQ